MPDNVITSILNRLPIKDAVRTDILVRNWRCPIRRKGIEDLTIKNCFRSFPNLLSLDLSYVTFQSCTFWEFIARCPLLEFLKINLVTTNEMKLIEIAKLKNIKKLYLAFGVLNKTPTITSSNIFQLTSLPKLEKLTLDFVECKLLAEANAEKKVPAAFLCSRLKVTQNAIRFDFMSNVMVSFIIEMICGSPNLQMLVTRASYMLSVVPSEFCSFDLDSNTMGPCSFRVLINRPRSDDEKKRIKINWELASKLLKLHRASTTAEIDFLEW
uniref:F-box domain-containing protein n=1 Tax=Tanacetum cinerariifolium TaxID=118510 RepID=A0A6L2JDQ3_TANCI|nr:hypothetical protein [Tanacetum cinerariifolium]